MNARLTTALITLGLLMLVAACSNFDNDTLATIADKSISLEEFTADNPASRFAGKDNDYIDSKVDEYVRKALFTQVAIDRGMGETEDVLEKKMKTEKRQMLQYVYTKAILDAVVSDEYVREVYDRSGTELNARHILLQYQGTSRAKSNRTKAEAMTLMQDIQARLTAGEDFQKLAGEFTDDPSGKTSGGDLGWFGWGKMVPPFQEAAFKLSPGEVSGIVETDFGYHIIKLEAKRETERGDFESEKASLKQQASREKSAELGRAANKFIGDRKSEAGFKVLTENVHDFFMIYDGSRFKDTPMDEALENLKVKMPLFTLNGEELGGEWIINELKAVDKGQRPRFSTENQLLTILDQIVTQYLIVTFGYENKYNLDDDFASQMSGLIERYAYDAFVAQEINANLTPSEDELMAFYEANKAEKYMDKKKVSVREIFIKDSLFAVSIKKRLDAGEAFEKLASRYTERKSTKDKEGLLPSFQEGRYGAMGRSAFAMEIGDVEGPVKLGNGYSIVRLEEVVPEGPKPYAKVKGRVRNEIISSLRTDRTDALYDELTGTYPVKVNYSAVHAFYKDSGEEK